MASLAAIRDAIKTTVETISGLRCHDTIPGSPNVPCVVVVPVSAEFVTMGRGVDEYEFDLLLLVQDGLASTAQDSLDAYVTGAGASSIRQAFFLDRDIGLANTEAHIARVSKYGQMVDVGGVEYLSATLRLIVNTSGTA